MTDQDESHLAADPDHMTGGTKVDLADDTGSGRPIDTQTASTGRVGGLKLVIIVVAMVVFIGTVIAAVVSVGGSPVSVPLGSGSATITWIPVATNNNGNSTPPQPFSGMIDGISLSGITTSPQLGGASSSSAIPSTVEAFRWKGSFDDKAFNLGLYLSASTATSSATAFPSITVRGTWGTERVKAKVTMPVSEELGGNGPLYFTGTVGDLKIAGKATNPSGTKGHQQGTATFTIST